MEKSKIPRDQFQGQENTPMLNEQPEENCDASPKE